MREVRRQTKAASLWAWRLLEGSFCFSARRLGQAVKEEIAVASSSLMSKTV